MTVFALYFVLARDGAKQGQINTPQETTSLKAEPDDQKSNQIARQQRLEESIGAEQSTKVEFQYSPRSFFRPPSVCTEQEKLWHASYTVLCHGIFHYSRAVGGACGCCWRWWRGRNEERRCGGGGGGTRAREGRGSPAVRGPPRDRVSAWQPRSAGGGDVRNGPCPARASPTGSERTSDDCAVAARRTAATALPAAAWVRCRRERVASRRRVRARSHG